MKLTINDMPAGLQTPPAEDNDYTSLLQIADVAGDEEEGEVVYDRMNFFPTTRH